MPEPIQTPEPTFENAVKFLKLGCDTLIRAVAASDNPSHWSYLLSNIETVANLAQHTAFRTRLKSKHNAPPVMQLNG